MRVGIVGASGFTGAELLRLCALHDELDVVVAGAESRSGTAVRDLYPSLASCYPSLAFSKVVSEDLAGLDLVFLALPHGESQLLAPELVDQVGVLVDLAADFRLSDANAYSQWYGKDHACPELLGSFAYGLPELSRADLRGASRVSVPGCYPTAAGLALAPLVRAGLVETKGVVVDAASGVSGAGSGLTRETHFNSVDEDFVAYGLLDHRHTPEIEQLTGAQVLFTPHLAPMNRGILATCYARPSPGAGGITTDDVLRTLRDAYSGEPFVVVSERPPSTKATLGSNCAHLTARVDPRTGWVVSICAIDNLTKGASGQAVQCANVALGLDERSGLPVAGVYP
ncbi:MAG TPA: N-acetyl-gamma-glutamyl-phosphate reductase [Acidimicrobiales bacterium]|nr:N-acetyl-gamma-glutamyl-phosphate reductase [Acidimicrobiales bacterium]